jgi:uncharacterized paraquat-inducible protein A
MNTMNQIRFDCPGCGQTMEMAEEAQFERVKCPTCQHEFSPDKTRPVLSAPAAPPPESASPAPTPPIQQRAIKLINCPACGLQISPQAASCPSCGHPVADSLTRVVSYRAPTAVEELPAPGLSYLLAIFLPLIGFFCGIWLMTRKQGGHGVAVMAISIFASLIWFAILGSIFQE